MGVEPEAKAGFARFWKGTTDAIGGLAGQAKRATDAITHSLVEHAEEAMKLAEPATSFVVEQSGHAYDAAKHAATSATRAVRAAKDEITTVIETLKSARQDAHDPAKLEERFLASLPHVTKYLDRNADGFAIGYSGEAVAGVGASIGAEVVYVRAKGDRPAHLRVNDLAGDVARISIGAGTRAFVRCMYGDADAILAAKSRRGAELGVLFASAGLFKTEVEAGHTPVKGWTAALGVGGGLGIPLVSDAGLFNVAENRVNVVELSRAATARIEAALDRAPDRSWLRDRALAM